MKSNPLFRCSDVPALLGHDEYRSKDDTLLNVIYRRFQSSIGKEYPDKIKELDNKIDTSFLLSALVQCDSFIPKEIEEKLCNVDDRQLVDRTISRNAMEIGKKSEKVLLSKHSIPSNLEKKYWKGKHYTLYGVADGVKESDQGVEEVTEIKTRMSNFHIKKDVPMKFWIQLICYIHLYNANKGILIEKFPNGEERRSEMTRKEANELWDVINEDLSKISQEVMSKTQEEIDFLCKDLS